MVTVHQVMVMQLSCVNNFMIKYSKLDSNNKVVEVIDIDDSINDIEAYLKTNYGESTLIKTDYYTMANVHYGTDLKPDGNAPLRKNYGAIGYSYDFVKDAFIPKKPFDSWILKEDTCNWEAPIQYPIGTNKIYKWNESIVNWEEVVSI